MSSPQHVGVHLRNKSRGHAGGHGYGKALFDALTFEWLAQLLQYVTDASDHGSRYTELERQIAGELPGVSSRLKVHQAKQMLPYNWIPDTKRREQLHSELLTSHNLGKFDILDLFNV